MARERPLYLTKTLLVDAFNLMYKFNDIYLMISKSKLESAMNELLKILADYRGKSSKKITVFFDGKKTEGNPVAHEIFSGMDIFYSHELSADFMIMEHVRHTMHPRELTVISSDKQVISFALRHRSYSMKSEDFEKIVTNVLTGVEVEEEMEKDSNPLLDKDDLDFWTKMFKSPPK